MNPYEVGIQSTEQLPSGYARSGSHWLRRIVGIVGCGLFGYCGPLLLFLRMCGIIGGWGVVLQNLNEFFKLHSLTSLNGIVGLAPNFACLLFFAAALRQKAGNSQYRFAWWILWSSTILGFAIGVPIAGFLRTDTVSYMTTVSAITLLVPTLVLVVHWLLRFNGFLVNSNPVSVTINLHNS